MVNLQIPDGGEYHGDPRLRNYGRIAEILASRQYTNSVPTVSGLA
jgi:hypothetical protein